MSAYRDATLRLCLALDDAAQIAALKALYDSTDSDHADVASSAPSHVMSRNHLGTSETGRAFFPLDGTLTTSPKGGLSWKPAPWPKTVINRANRDLIHVCIDHSDLEPQCKRSAKRMAQQRAELERWRHVRGIYTLQGYGTPDTWRMPTLALVLQDVLRAIPTIHPGVTPEVDEAIVRASAYPLRYNPDRHASQFLIRAEAGLPGDNAGLLRCSLYFASDASSCVRDWINHFPSWSDSTTLSEDQTLARVIRLKRATNGPPPAASQPQYGTTAEDDDTEDDDGDDLVSLVFLHTARAQIAPQATWDDIKAYIRGMVRGLGDKYGERR
jgi:hypothetical protein